MQIGICDDIPQLCKIQKETILSGNFLHEEDRIIEFHSASEVLSYITSNPLDLLFLDISMPVMSGVELIRKHLALFENTKVVFLTSYDNYVHEGYELNIYRYLQKPLQTEKLAELFHALEQESIPPRTITLHNQGTDITIPVPDILYAEVYNNYTSLVLPQRSYKCYMRLKDLHSQLSEDYFYQPNKSYLINLHHVLTYNNNTRCITMVNDTKITVSYRRHSEFRRVYVNFLIHHK